MLLCQISDTHIRPDRKLAYGVVDTATMLERCVAQVLKLPQRPDAVIITGDLTDCGQAKAYELLRALLAPLSMPCYLMPGNHDQRTELREAFPEHAYLRHWEPYIQYVIDEHPVRIVALDTLIPMQSHGLLCAERLHWLDCALAQSSQPTVVALHHPPFVTGIGHMDRIPLLNADSLGAIVARHPHVERVIAGHLHRPITVRFAGTVATTCPSPAHQVALDIAPDAADRFVFEPPGFQLHWWNGSALVTHTAYVGEFEGPFPFRADGKLIE